MTPLASMHSNKTKEPRKLLSDEDAVIFDVVTHVCLCGLVGLFGIIANIINVIMFMKQGFKSTVNISLLGLAVSDICCLITTQWLNLCLNPWFQNSGVPLKTEEVLYLTAGWPQKCFSRITNLITVYITAERCLCIVFPLKVKTLVTPTRTAVIIFFIYVTMMITVLSEYVTSYLDWKYFPETNKTLIGLHFTTNRKYVEGLAFLIQAVVGVFSFLALIAFTIVLVWKLRLKSKWQKKVVSSKHELLSQRDSKTARMIVLISCVLIICYTPGIILFAVCFFVPEFSILGLQSNMFLSMWSLAFLSESINSSINIVLYYRMSSKFRHTFQRTFFCCFTPEVCTAPDSLSRKDSSIAH